MQVHANLEVVVFRHHRANQIANLLRARHSHRVRKRDHPQVVHFHERDGLDHLIWSPQVAIRIPERHRNINHDVEPRIVGLLLNFFQLVDRLLGRLVLILSQKAFRNGIGKSQRRNRLRLNRPLRSFFVDHDADNLYIIGRIEFFQDFFRVRHLRHCFRRDE